MKKKTLTPDQLQKQWVKKLKIWKKISDRIRITENTPGRYGVETRKYNPFNREWSEWDELNSYGAMKHALKKKHSFIVMILMRDMGLRNEFVKKRTDRKKKKGII